VPIVHEAESRYINSGTLNRLWRTLKNFSFRSRPGARPDRRRRLSACSAEVLKQWPELYTISVGSESAFLIISRPKRPWRKKRSEGDYFTSWVRRRLLTPQESEPRKYCTSTAIVYEHKLCWYHSTQTRGPGSSEGVKAKTIFHA